MIAQSLAFGSSNCSRQRIVVTYRHLYARTVSVKCRISPVDKLLCTFLMPQSESSSFSSPASPSNSQLGAVCPTTSRICCFWVSVRRLRPISSFVRVACLASRMSSSATHSSLPKNHPPSNWKVRYYRESISASARVYKNLSPSSALLQVALMNSVLRQLLLVTA